MNTKLVIAFAVSTGLVLSGCSVRESTPSEANETTSTETVEVTPDRTKVEWEDYDPSVKTNIDSLEAAKDCAGLQSQFDIADANSDATMSRTGHSNANLMIYIEVLLF